MISSLLHVHVLGGLAVPPAKSRRNTGSGGADRHMSPLHVLRRCRSTWRGRAFSALVRVPAGRIFRDQRIDRHQRCDQHALLFGNVRERYHCPNLATFCYASPNIVRLDGNRPQIAGARRGSIDLHGGCLVGKSSGPEWTWREEVRRRQVGSGIPAFGPALRRAGKTRAIIALGLISAPAAECTVFGSAGPSSTGGQPRVVNKTRTKKGAFDKGGNRTPHTHKGIRIKGHMTGLMKPTTFVNFGMLVRKPEQYRPRALRPQHCFRRSARSLVSRPMPAFLRRNVPRFGCSPTPEAVTVIQP